MGFVSDRSLRRDAAVCWTDGATARLIDALRTRCDDLTAALSAAPTRLPAHDCPIALPTNRILDLPWVPSIGRGFFQFKAARKVVRAIEQHSDVVVVQLPFAAVTALSHPLRPRVYHVCANVRTIVTATKRYRGIKRAAAEALSRYLDHRQRRLIHEHNARVVTNGRELLDHYSAADRGRAVVSSTLLPEEILSVKRSRPADSPFRVLFVGFLRHEKGVDTLLPAFERLLNDVPRAELHIVGAKDLSEHGVSQQIREAVDRIGQRAAVRLFGQVPFGPELFQHYADADVCVVPSRSEGTPRVLIEARAFGCPVIGSNVGGIPFSICNEEDGLLVPVDDVAALCTAMLRIAQDETLRARLTAAGVARARRTTIDDFANEIVAEARRALESQQTACSSTL